MNNTTYRFADESKAMAFARSQAEQGHVVSVEPANAVGADTVVTVARVWKAETPEELRQWLRSMDDGYNQDGELYEKCALMVDAIGGIQRVLDGVDWTPETLDFIADQLRDAGLEVRDVGLCDCDSRSWHGAEHDSACPLVGLPRV